MDGATSFFVYGTLKRGECRERMWPHAPVEIQPAFAWGFLYDLGPYPAMTPGDDWIAGEIWTIASPHVAETLVVLDEIEGYDVASDNNLYDRVQIDWHRAPGDSSAGGTALTYHYARTDRLLAGQRIIGTQGEPAHWPSAG
ncbi:Gamma-L-glutamyl-butirosin B gamma-glutamyl cyclotransferase [Rosistilla ulvae]|uniref:Gamma-L-glutamyl-butirosin B gamma-glutamyl cyclotransferase n=1 Tax=Rosistilla ulvae TaxID=1930277 RepID=A0A517M036_9BACT|nr:gamma-glutamylcyclotransferase family protein [Rosistilla ulvae]QDS88236.1 Gamma-L-glutamyl-butirosin B gamma-glutamyl cyclotransferase [Rosistilla ulvae]